MAALIKFEYIRSFCFSSINFWISYNFSLYFFFAVFQEISKAMRQRLGFGDKTQIRVSKIYISTLKAPVSTKELCMLTSTIEKHLESD